MFDYSFVSKTGQFNHLELIDANNLNFDYFNGNLSVLRYIANNTSQQDGSLIKQLMDYVNHMLWFRSVHAKEYIGFRTGTENLEDWIISNHAINEFATFLRQMGDINVQLEVSEGNSNGSTNRPILVEKHKTRALRFPSVASSGTQALELLFYWNSIFSEISFLFIDEFDAFYHFSLSMAVCKKLFALCNTQVILISHNTYLMTNDLLRPDCNFIINNNEIKALCDCTEKELRWGHNIEKMYRGGAFEL